MNIAPVSEKTIRYSTMLWAALMMISGLIINSGIRVSEHFSFEILLEFSRAVSIWYIIALACSCIIDISSKKSR